MQGTVTSCRVELSTGASHVYQSQTRPQDFTQTDADSYCEIKMATVLVLLVVVMEKVQGQLLLVECVCLFNVFLCSS
jgi:hypothetical protein